MNPYSHVVRTVQAFQFAHMQHIEMNQAYQRKATDVTKRARDAFHKLKIAHREDMTDAITDAIGAGMLPDTLRNALSEGLDNAKTLFACSVSEVRRP